MPARKYLIFYMAALVAFVALDYLWLGLIATTCYMDGIGHLAAPAPNFVAAAIFYLCYPLGLMFFAARGGERLIHVAGRAALVGVFAYGTYDLTNLATLRDWPLDVALIDMLWGTLVSTLSAGIAWLIAGRLP